MTVTFFFLDRTFINRPKELRWAATTIGKLPTWFCCSASLHFFLNYDTTGLFIFCRYIDDGFMLIDKNNNTAHITHLSSTYPSQIPITLPQTVISLTTWTSHFHSITTLSCITKFTIAFIKNHITNTCIHISHLIIQNTFSQTSSRLRQYDTADCQRPKTTTTLYTDCLLYDLLH